MFINKHTPLETASSKKMSTNFMYSFLNTEITCIPKIITKIVGKYYNNALCNGATWVFVFWALLHIGFDKCIDALLKRLKYKQYVRTRLKSSLWYLGFFGTALVYCGAALAQNEVELFNFKRMQVLSDTQLPDRVVLGYTLISTFYMHAAFWEGLYCRSLTSGMAYLFLSFVSIFSFILRIVEISFTLTALIGIGQVLLEFTRLFYLLTKQEGYVSKIFIGALFILSFAVFIALHIVVIPLTFIVPLGLKIMSDYPYTLLIMLFFALLGWLTVEIYKSVLFKFADHWLYHGKEKEGSECSSGFLECSLFSPRDDDTYHINALRSEIKNREQEMMSMRKPKNRSMLIQTLKCMVAIKRKLSEKRLSESSDSDDSEKSDDSQSKTDKTALENEDDSEKDEASDDENSNNEDSEDDQKSEETEEIEEGTTKKACKMEDESNETSETEFKKCAAIPEQELEQKPDGKEDEMKKTESEESEAFKGNIVEHGDTENTLPSKSEIQKCVAKEETVAMKKNEKSLSPIKTKEVDETSRAPCQQSDVTPDEVKKLEAQEGENIAPEKKVMSSGGE